ncbi:fibronectin type III domain-containing protein [Pedobacter montanisoli]|uniref:Fibronectin type III domain-containing protein n=1 Tax=Pedobacter montanisoli TaxID=2923277 RepID=A0ABS9ZVE4_9SPHI|nr:fibronectin type III domain-containing protein [Pedobacter montanisoli]MCJ0741434.1 fibronectin type III domain-containing protein [Pedobacter montanisoli]
MKLPLKETIGLVVALCVSFCCTQSAAQQISKYAFSSTTSTFSSISGLSLLQGGSSNYVFNDVNIGFDFWYMGNRYTKLSVSTNGLVRLGANLTQSYPNNDFVSVNNEGPVLAPLWDDIVPLDLSLLSSTNYSTKIEGAYPNRIFTIEWNGMRWDKNAQIILALLSVSTISFQLKVFENGNVQFNYRRESTQTSANNRSATVGIGGPPGKGFLSLNNLSGTATVSSASSTNSINGMPLSNQVFVFDPQETTAPSNLAFTSISTNVVTLNWTDNSNDELGFAIYRSTTSTGTYDYIGQVAPDVTSFNNTGLSAGTTYYYKVFAIRENLSASVDGTVKTLVSCNGSLWLGNTNTDWTEPNNWCGGIVPNSSADVLIPASAPRFPVISSLTVAAVRNLNIENGASVQNNGTIKIAGQLSNTGQIIANNGSVEFNGATVQTLYGNVFQQAVIYRLVINNPANVTLSGTLNITDLLTVENGIFYTNDGLVLKSTQTQTAAVAPVPTNNSIRGKVTVERFIKGGVANIYRTYRMLSSAVYNNSDNFINTDLPGNRTYILQDIKNSTIVTGTGGVAAGFDFSYNNDYPSLYTHNGNFVAVTNMQQSVASGKGIYLFFRGNRNNPETKIKAPYANPEDVVMGFRGNLNQQDITVNLVYNNALTFNLLGNPYASAIDWDSTNWGTDKVNIEGTVWIYNPVFHNYSTYKNGIGVNGGARYIASGQSFFVQSNAASAKIKFKESIKASSVKPVAMLNTNENIPAAKQGKLSFNSALDLVNGSVLRIKMKALNSYNEDEIALVFKDQSNDVFDKEDSYKLAGETIALSSLSSDKEPLGINFMSTTTNESKIVGLKVTSSANGQYLLNFDLKEFDPKYTIKLRDKYLNTIKELIDGDIYSFEINKSETGSQGAERFSLLFEPVQTLSAEQLKLLAFKINYGIVLRWEYLKDTRQFIVEKMGANGIYRTLKEVEASADRLKYEVADLSPDKGANYYRLIQQKSNGQVISDPIYVKFDLVEQAKFVAWPSPVKSTINFKYNGLLDQEKYEIKVSGVDGKRIAGFSVAGKELINGIERRLDFLKAGTYLVVLTSENHLAKIDALKIIKE